MLFRLALALGRTVDELRGVLSYREFQEWCLFYQIEPWGDARADLRAGIVASTVANVYTLWARGEANNQPADFMPYLKTQEAPPVEPEAQQQLTDEQLAAWADAALYGIAPGD